MACRTLASVIVVVGLAVACTGAFGADWSQWGGRPDKNMASDEKGLPDTFTPGEKDPQGSGIKMETTQNVRWAARVGAMACSTPAVAGGKVFVGAMRDDMGAFLCLDEATGKPLWQWVAPLRSDVPQEIDGRRCEFARFPRQLGVCSSPAVDGDRLYFVDHRLNVLCVTTAGKPKAAQPAKPAAEKPADAGATGTAGADASYRKNLGNLFFQLEYVGAEEERYTRAILTTTDVTGARIDQAQAARLLNYLAADGFFGRAKTVPPQDDHDGEFPGVEAPCYALTIRAEGCPTLREAMGWGPPLAARIEALRKVVEGGAGREIDGVLTSVTGRPVWSQPVNGLRARLQTYGVISKRLGMEVQAVIENVSDKMLAVDLGMLDRAAFRVAEDQKPEAERTRPRTVSWTVLRPGDSATYIVGKEDQCRDGHLDMGSAVWNLRPGPNVLGATISDDGSQPGKPAVAAAWSGEIELPAAPFWVYGGKTPADPGAKDKSGKAPAPKVQWPEGPGEADIVWEFDMWKFGIRPSDACDCSPVYDDKFVYVCTANGVDREAEMNKHDEFRKVPAPDAPNVIVLDKKTGRLVATDDVRYPDRMFHGQWSSLALGQVGGKTLIFFGGGDGRCYAFEAPAEAPEKPLTLKKVWVVDCNPKEYQVFGDRPLITHYCLGDRRRSDALNKVHDGNFVGMSEIIATPVFYKNRVYVAIGRDPEHGRGRGALWCIDATKTGDITESGKVWRYQGLDRSLSTVSIADGLLYVSDVGGRLHCLDADTGKVQWIFETNSKVWGSTLVADGKVYMPTEKGLFILAAGKELKSLSKIIVGAPVWASPVAANGTLFVTSKNWMWAVQKNPAAAK